MEKSLQPRSIKLKLEQPGIICSGRTKVECFYRGKVVNEDENCLIVTFKSYGHEQRVLFQKFDGMCITKDWQDLKISGGGGVA